MSDKINDGGPAFPTTWPDQCPGEGTSLRDWFAGKALAGMLADPNVLATAPEVADTAYRFSDAMLEARKK
jgi:hypothetical protein